MESEEQYIDLGINNNIADVVAELRKICGIQPPEESTHRIYAHPKPEITEQRIEAVSRQQDFSQQDYVTSQLISSLHEQEQQQLLVTETIIAPIVDVTSQLVSLHEQEKQKLLAAEAIIAPMIGTSIPCRMEEPTASSVPPSTNFQRVVIAMSLTRSGSCEKICQIAAVHADKVSYVYNRYITPKQEAAEATGAQYFVLLDSGLTISRAVITVAESEAIKGFVDYLCDDDSKKILVAHDGEKFDFPVLLEHVKKYNLMDSFKEVVIGFVDTMPLFKCLFPCRQRYRLVDLARDILGHNDTAYSPEQEVSVLAQLISHNAVFPRALLKGSLTLDYYLKCDEYDAMFNRNKSTYNMLVKTGVMTSYMAEKTASSGLGYDHLYLAYEAAGPEGLNVLVSLPWGGNGPRVTKNKGFIEAFANYFEHLRKNRHPMRHPPWYKPCRFN